MNIVYFLIPLALLLGGSFALSFGLAAMKGQFDDLETPAHRLLLSDDPDASVISESNRHLTKTELQSQIQKGLNS